MVSFADVDNAIDTGLDAIAAGIVIAVCAFVLGVILLHAWGLI